MKMTTVLCRVVSLWLFVAVVCRYHCYYVGCTERDEESQRPSSSQDFSAEKETGETVPKFKVEEGLLVPALPLSENDQPVEDSQPKEKQAAGEQHKQPYTEATEVAKPVLDVESKAEDRVLQPERGPEQITENSLPEAANTPKQEATLIQSSPEPKTAAEKDESGAINAQDNTPDSVPDEISDVAAAEMAEADQPPADCEEEKNPYNGDGNPPTILENTSNVHIAGTKSHTEPPLTPPADPGTRHLESNASHTKQAQSSPATVDTDSTVSSRDPEDIPTFDEWKRKVMEVEKEKTQSVHTANNGAPPAVKKVQKNFNNYASVECGAKILGANPEAKSTSAILMENMDLYMLNPCSNKIWFIIELCEPVQVKQLDIANFELFSSTPKDFLVSISDRYPTNKWQKLGTFHARDERTVQSFPLDERLYAKYVKMFTKYIKVELVSHFGSEHFCPLSLIRVFGTSMVEEYEENTDPSERPDDPDDDLDYPAGYASGEAKLSKNLIGSAKDAILSMVNNIAVNVLGGGEPETQGNVSSQVNMTEPSSQLETTSETTATHIPPVPGNDEETTSPEPEAPEPLTPSAETFETETTSPEQNVQELPQVEEKVIIPSDRDEEEPISSTITLLDKEEELDEDKEERDYHGPRRGNQDYCTLLSPFSSFCCCAASLEEYLHQQCSASMPKKRKCQALDKRQTIASVKTPVWHQSLFPTACPDPQQQQQPGDEVHQLREEEEEQAADLEPGSRASPSEMLPPPLEGAQESPEEPAVLEAAQLEPSQTSNLPKASATDSSSAKLSPIVRTPQLSSQEPESNRHVPPEEQHAEPTASPSGSAHIQPTAAGGDAAVAVIHEKEEEKKSDARAPLQEVISPVGTPEAASHAQVLQPSPSHAVEQNSDVAAAPEGDPIPPEVADPPATDGLAEPQPSAEQAPVTGDARVDSLPEEVLVSPPPPTLPASNSLLDIYADPPNGTEQNGNPVHGSSQKESVFMRLNNRIKALEMNMSLSGRYLEQLSQRYRKQMEEMQKAFNTTIIKLQNTSRIAEEQDQRQTESIQSLQGQLENVTQLVLNLSVRVSQLQIEVADRQNYLLLSLLLCFCLGLLLFGLRRQAPPTATVPLATDLKPPTNKNYSCCHPESRQFSACDDTGLKRSASFPLIHSESLQLATAGDADMLHGDSTHGLCPANRKRRRRKVKSLDKVETVKAASFLAAAELRNGGAKCNGIPAAVQHPALLTHRLMAPVFRDSPSEGSSEGSSHSDELSFCGITTACTRMCDGLPRPKTRGEKQASRRRRLKPSGFSAAELLQPPPPHRDGSEAAPPISVIQDLMKARTEPSSGTLWPKAGLSAPL